MDQFPPVRASVAATNTGALMQLVGRIALPNFNPQQGLQQVMYSPGSNSACVYWRVIVEEEWIEWREEAVYESNADGEQHQVDTRWVQSTRWNSKCVRASVYDLVASPLSRPLRH